MKRAGEEMASSWEPDFICYGIAVGTDNYVRHKLQEKVKEVKEVVKAVRGVLEPQKLCVLFSSPPWLRSWTGSCS